MKAVERVAVPILLVVTVLVVAAWAVFAGITEPAGRMLGLSGRHADIAACWVVFLALPLLCAIDALRLSTARWCSARRSKSAWLAIIAYVPIVGPLLYVTVARPYVSGAAPERAPAVALP